MPTTVVASASSFTQVFPAGHGGHIAVVHPGAGHALRSARTGRSAGEVPEGNGQLIKVTKPTRSGTVRVTFALPATEPAGAVSVVGDFNDWNPYAHPLRKRGNGLRSVVVTMQAAAPLPFPSPARRALRVRHAAARVRARHR